MTEQKSHNSYYSTDMHFYKDVLWWLKKRLSLAVVELRQSRGEGFREGFGGLFVSDEEVNAILLTDLGGTDANARLRKTRWSATRLGKIWRRIELNRAAPGGMKLS
ncbi:MAG: hypothetical protein MJK04_19530, partial [Psychrosphaera sp.]|nr:hypothetical protein [Psychrosphaera sp.]